MVATQATKEMHYQSSVFREVLVEHLLIGELLRSLWNHAIPDVEILRSEFDAGGYDLVLSHRSITRHVQLKSKIVGGSTSSVNISLNLTMKPSGCVLWVEMTEGMQFHAFRWLGDAPGRPLPDISSYPVTKHTKGNSNGEKLERSNLRKVPIRAFRKLSTIDEVLSELIGL